MSLGTCKSKHITLMLEAHSCLHVDCPLLHSCMCDSYPASPTLVPRWPRPLPWVLCFILYYEYTGSDSVFARNSITIYYRNSIIETLLLSLLFLSVNVVCLTWKLCLTSMLEVIILSSIPQNFKENFRVLQFLSLWLLCKTILSWIPRYLRGNRDYINKR